MLQFLYDSGMGLLLAVAPVAENPFAKILEPVIGLLNMVLAPAIALIGALGAIYCVFLGVKLAKAEEPQERDKAKNALKNAILGFVLIFVLIVVLRVAIGPLQSWMDSSSISASPAPSVKPQ